MTVPASRDGIGEDEARDFAAAERKKLVEFLKWALTEGQKDAAPLNYAPLPEALASKELDALKQIRLPAS